MKVIKNPEVFKISGDKTVTVSVTFDVGTKTNERDILLNAAEAIKFYADNKAHKSWERNIAIK